MWIFSPKTSKSVSTGVKATEKQFAALSEHAAQLMMCCPVCGHDHAWLAMRPRLFIDVKQLINAA
jgi:hypothetical protein